MTDYNDGKWHGWNGGECPLHDETIVEVRNLKSGKAGEYRSWSEGGINRAGWFNEEVWSGVDSDEYNPIIAFHVIKPYREPREFTLVLHKSGYVLGGDYFPACELEGHTFVKVREVLDDPS